MSCFQREEVLQLFTVRSGWPGQAVTAVSRCGRHQLRVRFQGHNRDTSSAETPNESQPSIVLGDDERPFCQP
jgi:hypothetical protein